jgi:hypothetical protein
MNPDPNNLRWREEVLWFLCVCFCIVVFVTVDLYGTVLESPKAAGLQQNALMSRAVAFTAPSTNPSITITKLGDGFSLKNNTGAGMMKGSEDGGQTWVSFSLFTPGSTNCYGTNCYSTNYSENIVGYDLSGNGSTLFKVSP